MANQHWLVKQEPETYSWNQFSKEKTTVWEGIRNFQARNHLRSMKQGDRVLFYHSGAERAVVGTAEVTREAFADPSADEGDWVAVELRAGAALSRPVSLAEIKAEPSLANLALLRQSRLSVVPLTKAEFTALVWLANRPPPA